MSLTARRGGGWLSGWVDYPPGGGVEADGKEEGGIWPPKGVEGGVHAGVEKFKR